jgi:hypothetical protein
MTPIWGLTESGVKKTGRDTKVLPRTVIYDPNNRGIDVLQSGKVDEDEHYYLDTESIFGFVYEIGNNGKIRPPDRRLG